MGHRGGKQRILTPKQFSVHAAGRGRPGKFSFMTNSRWFLVGLGLFSVAVLLWAANSYGNLGVSPGILLATRWLAIAGFVAYAWQKKSLTTWILVAMVVGAEIGNDWPSVGVSLRLLSQIFLKMIKTIIAPLLFATLVVGIAGHSNLRQVGRMGVKALIYFEVVTTIALFIGLAAINISQAGVGINLPPATTADPSLTATSQSPSDIILHIFPENLAKSVAEGQVLQIVVFSIIFGIALAMLSEQKRKPMLSFCEGLSETMFKFTNIVMLFAPIGVGAAIAYTVGHMGLGILINLFKMLATLYAALFVFVRACWCRWPC